MINIKEQTHFFCDMTKQINSIYEDYARSLGLTYTSLYILHMIALTENCTQKILAEQMFIPKQTINSIITQFRKQGWIELQEIPEDKRHKTLHLTSQGKQFGAKVFPPIEIAEQKSLAQFSKEERQTFLRLMKKYVTNFASELNH